MLNARPQVILQKQPRRPERIDSLPQALWLYFCEYAEALVVLGSILLVAAVMLPPMLHVHSKAIATTAEVCARQVQAALQTGSPEDALSQNALSSCGTTTVTRLPDAQTFTIQNPDGQVTYTVSKETILASR